METRILLSGSHFVEFSSDYEDCGNFVKEQSSNFQDRVKTGFLDHRLFPVNPIPL